VEESVVSTASILGLVVVVPVAVVPSSTSVDGSVVSASAGINWCIVATAAEDCHAGSLRLGCERRHYECGGGQTIYIL
jgi:hypothetical protein